MTNQQIKQRIAEIRGAKPEQAKAMQDALRRDFIQFIAEIYDMLPHLAQKAKLVLSYEVTQ